MHTDPHTHAYSCRPYIYPGSSILKPKQAHDDFGNNYTSITVNVARSM